MDICVLELKNSKQYTLTLFKKSISTLSVSTNQYWIRVLGTGIIAKSNKSPLTFSERNKYKKTLKIFNYRLSFLD
ncbi:hypothetical protein ACE193_15275 [Bernardetia sp. OM2101]|uniref:hypothetical protein n=1 Tax=Bernardetia sp. OM2101 TaxID=3344876 RepID=UPI0035CE914A